MLRTVVRLAFIAAVAAAGVLMLAQAIKGTEFRFAILGRRRNGPRIPTWLGKIISFLFGVFALWFAFEYYNQR